MKKFYEKPMIEVRDYSLLPLVECGISSGDEFTPGQQALSDEDLFA